LEYVFQRQLIGDLLLKKRVETLYEGKVDRISMCPAGLFKLYVVNKLKLTIEESIKKNDSLSIINMGKFSEFANKKEHPNTFNLNFSTSDGIQILNILNSLITDKCGYELILNSRDDTNEPEIKFPIKYKPVKKLSLKYDPLILTDYNVSIKKLQ
jgi:hypothetical protein